MSRFGQPDTYDKRRTAIRAKARQAAVDPRITETHCPYRRSDDRSLWLTAFRNERAVTEILLTRKHDLDAALAIVKSRLSTGESFEEACEVASDQFEGGVLFTRALLQHGRAVAVEVK